MIAIQSAIYSALGQYAGVSALVGTRIYPDVADQDCARPFIVWMELETEQMNSLAGSVESSGLTNYLIEITSWAVSRTASRELDAQVRLAMIAATSFKSLLSNAQTLGQEPDTKLFGYQSDFSVWLKT